MRALQGAGSCQTVSRHLGHLQSSTVNFYGRRRHFHFAGAALFTDDTVAADGMRGLSALSLHVVSECDLGIAAVLDEDFVGVVIKLQGVRIGFPDLDRRST
jgi:hypothetical protein